MSVEPPPPPAKSYTPPVSQTVYSYPPSSAPNQDMIKPSAPPQQQYYPPQQQPVYTYAQMPYQQAAAWTPTYQGQMYPPPQFQQRYVVTQAQQQQPPNQTTGLGIAGGFLAGMVVADILDDITDP